jgi:hypothetical protein
VREKSPYQRQRQLDRRPTSISRRHALRKYEERCRKGALLSRVRCVDHRVQKSMSAAHLRQVSRDDNASLRKDQRFPIPRHLGLRLGSVSKRCVRHCLHQQCHLRISYDSYDLNPTSASSPRMHMPVARREAPATTTERDKSASHPRKRQESRTSGPDMGRRR